MKPISNTGSFNIVVLSALFTYCLRGSRSRGMVKTLKAMGYTQVINMGGINNYKGELEH